MEIDSGFRSFRLIRCLQIDNSTVSFTDVVHSTAYSTDSADTVSEAVIKIYPHLCPAELAVSMLRFVRWTLCHEEPLETSFKSLGVTELQQTTVRIFKLRQFMETVIENFLFFALRND